LAARTLSAAHAKKPLKTALVAAAQILSAAIAKKSSENYHSFGGTKTFRGKQKKLVKTTLVLGARGGPPKMMGKFL
jgi:hypothetical protein